MATYVVSDIHGHLQAFKSAVEQAQITEQDELYVLGDLIDRGPDPLGVIEYVRSLPNVHVLMGNHEQLMLLSLQNVAPPEDGHFDLTTMGESEFSDWLTWTQNGGGTTIAQLEKLSEDEFLELIAWTRELSFCEILGVAGCIYILVHAGIDVLRSNLWFYNHPDADRTNILTYEQMMAEQNLEDLVWIREDFWSRPTNFINEKGEGAVIIAGHTPSYNLQFYTDEAHEWTSPEGKGIIIGLGATEATGGIAERVDIDCCAAVGAPLGRVGIMRLDDGAQFFGDIVEGE